MASYDYVVVGAGLAGASAVEGIRERDKDGSILLLGMETHLPYHRPPLSKGLWFRKTTVEKIPVRDEGFYAGHRIELRRGRRAVALDPVAKTITDDSGEKTGFGKLLLAAGGTPRRLPIPGGDLEGIVYYRTLDDYEYCRTRVGEGRTAVVIGGGFIGSELAAALHANGSAVTMLFPGEYLCDKVFPADLGRTLTGRFEQRGIEIRRGTRPASFTREGTHWVALTETGGRIESDLIVVGIGIMPATDLAVQAGLEVDDGIRVDDYLRTSHPDVYAAGDIARFHDLARDRYKRVEHWDNALVQGKWAGRNMAGAEAAYDYEPYFYSDLFEFGYEAVGEVDARLPTYADWQTEYETGVVYYLRDERVRGVMLCNVWGKLDAARTLIRSEERVSPETLHGRIRPD